MRQERLGQAGWLAELPLKHINAFGWIPKTRDIADRVTHCLRFFGVASVDAWRQRYAAPVAAFRAQRGREMAVGAVATWLRQGERQAEALDCRPFDAGGFRAALQEFAR